MKIGVIFPQTEIGSDPFGVRDYAQAVESMGYNHILAYDHVLGAEPSNRGFSGRYTERTCSTSRFVSSRIWPGT